MDGLSVGGRHRLKSSLFARSRRPPWPPVGRIDRVPPPGARGTGRRRPGSGRFDWGSLPARRSASLPAAPAAWCRAVPPEHPSSVGGLAFTESSTVSSSNSLTETSALISIDAKSPSRNSFAMAPCSASDMPSAIRVLLQWTLCRLVRLLAERSSTAASALLASLRPSAPGFFSRSRPLAHGQRARGRSPLAGSARALRARTARTNSCSHASFAANSTEESGLGLLNHFDFGVVAVDAQVGEGTVRRLFDCLSCSFYPLHGLTRLSLSLRP